MTLLEMKKKVLSLIEEFNPDSEFLTDDSDISAKLNEVINQILFELARIKKIPKYVEMEVSAGDRIDLETIEKECGSVVYQLGTIGGVAYSPKAGGTVLKFSESGTAEIDLYVYPEKITENTDDKNYEFELSADALEIMPYGVAADLLKSDESAAYGNLFAARYESMLQRLDPRYQMPSITIKGGSLV